MIPSAALVRASAARAAAAFAGVPAGLGATELSEDDVESMRARPCGSVSSRPSKPKGSKHVASFSSEGLPYAMQRAKPESALRVSWWRTAVSAPQALRNTCSTPCKRQASASTESLPCKRCRPSLLPLALRLLLLLLLSRAGGGGGGA